ncbi:MAG: glycosyltransferase family 4 protein [Williamsia sp.]|nr:glycosyltransferase family 4 protein [Williamsia sp.]
MKDTNQPKTAYPSVTDQLEKPSWSEIRAAQAVQRVKIAYYCLNDPLDKRSWSGIPYYLGQTLHKHIGEVDFLGPVKVPWLLEKTMRAVMKFTRYVLRREYLPQYSLLKNKWAARYLKQRMKGKQYNLLIAPAAASELAFLHTDLPVVYFGDATFKAYSNTYKTVFDKVVAFTKWEGNYLEKRSLKKSSLIVLTSRWAAQSAINDYGVPAGKIEVILLGASIDHPPARDIIFQKEANKTLTLLFLAVDWERKGGAIAFAALEHLHKRGIQARLVVCGVIPPPEFFHPCMDVIPFVDKNLTEDYKLFLELFSSAHFMLLPTRADCTPVVNSESSAYGVPVITTDVGGVSDTVEDGVNGYCLPLEAGGEAYATLIAELFADKERYHQLIRSTRDRYERDLNWDAWADQFKKVLERHAL